MMRAGTSAAATIAVAALLVACGGGGSGGSAASGVSSVATPTADASDAKQYFPLGTGDVWVYQKPPLSTQLGGPTYEVSRIEGPRDLAGESWFAMSTRLASFIPNGTTDYYRNDADGIFLRLGLPGSTEANGAGKRARTRSSDRAFMVRRSASGSRWK